MIEAKVNLNVGMEGRYRLQVRGPDGEIRKDTGWFKNLILDAGLNRIGSGSAIGTHCHVGSGSNVPNVADTALQSFVASTSSNPTISSDYVNSGATQYGWTRKTFRFNTGVAAGNLSEVGVGWSSTTGGLFSRALILDGSGNPNTITVLSDEVLDVIYELRLYPPLDDTAYSITISGVTYSGVCRAAYAVNAQWSPITLLNNGTNGNTTYLYAYEGGIGAFGGSPSGTSAAGVFVFNAYSNNSYQLTATVTYGLSNANFGTGIGSFGFIMSGSWAFQFSVSPKIPKNDTKVLTINLTTAWSRKTI